MPTMSASIQLSILSGAAKSTSRHFGTEQEPVQVQCQGILRLAHIDGKSCVLLASRQACRGASSLVVKPSTSSREAALTLKRSLQ